MRAEAVLEDRGARTKANEGTPRWFDLTVAAAGLVVTSPVIALLGLLVAAFSGPPIFFRQTRIGQNGRAFDLYKLRTMTPSVNGPQVTSENDSRITWIGRFLRRTKLDELPTLWNVVKGDMALVGPRPEVPRYVTLDDPNWRTVLEVKPGITDPVTLHLRNEERLLANIDLDAEEYYLKVLQPEKLKGYISYQRRRSWLTDLKVLCGTISAVLVPRSSSMAQTNTAK